MKNKFEISLLLFSLLFLSINVRANDVYVHVNTGDGNQAVGDPDTNAGTPNSKAGAVGVNSIAIGKDAKAYVENYIALGDEVINDYVNEPIGKQSIIVMALGYYNDLEMPIEGADAIESNGVVAVGRRIINVASGKISDDLTDAINGSQIHALANTLLEQMNTFVYVNNATENIYPGEGADNNSGYPSQSGAASYGENVTALGTYT